jgi:hypothetical protein
MTRIHHRQGREIMCYFAGIICAGALLTSNSQASLLLKFDGGGSSTTPVTSSVDAYTGMAGGGWASSWIIGNIIPANITFSSAVTNANPFSVGSGNYLAVKYLSNSTTASRAGVVRQFSTNPANGGVDVTQAFEVSFEMRFDDIGGVPMNSSSDQYYFSLGPNSVNSFSSSSPIRIWYQGDVGWRVNDGNSYIAIDSLPTNVSVGLVYQFKIQINPTANTWSLSVAYDGDEYVMADLDLWSGTSLSSSNYLSWRGTRSQQQMDWSLDNIQVAAVPEPTSLSVIGFGGLVLMHFGARRRR